MVELVWFDDRPVNSFAVTNMKMGHLLLSSSVRGWTVGSEDVCVVRTVISNGYWTAVWRLQPLVMRDEGPISHRCTDFCIAPSLA